MKDQLYRISVQGRDQIYTSNGITEANVISGLSSKSDIAKHINQLQAGNSVYAEVPDIGKVTIYKFKDHEIDMYLKSRPAELIKLYRSNNQKWLERKALMSSTRK